MTPSSGVHPVDEVLPPQQMASYGLQHVLVLYAGAVAGGAHRDGHTNNRGSGRTDDSRSTSPSTRQSRT